MPLTKIQSLGITDGTIVNADINASAAIAGTKLGSGAVLQVVNATYSTATTNNTNTYADTGLTASITPSSASNKVLVLISLNGCSKNTGNTGFAFKLVRGATDIHNIDSVVAYTGTTTDNNTATSTSYLDSPSSTSSTTYKVQFKSFNNLSSVTLNSNSTAGGTVSSMTLIEIKG
jgi:hypothetical protein